MNAIDNLRFEFLDSVMAGLVDSFREPCSCFLEVQQFVLWRNTYMLKECHELKQAGRMTLVAEAFPSQDASQNTSDQSCPI
jgi:hypothetical protein